ncbi:DUF3558 family protein [Actinokineospora globicatena]|uniref:DUF3558 domain-containing protein n=1 Tax=Actinokineospora globicatena TaxID=103729 RepID=A0A9W6QV09_9PSEU|nr:DUF3558 family protein [Actinokineospora globicatena]GLW95114.1 hypothetical protein Aglo03_59300 [Actinokineospora globicatena]
MRFPLLAAGAVLLTSCSADPAPAPPPAAPVVSTLAAPAVSTPLRIDEYTGEPCLLITVDDLQVDYPVSDHITSNGEDQCWYEATSSDYGTFQTRISTDTSPLEAAYRNASRYEHFEPTVIEGMPAVTAAEKRDGTDGCAIIVGTSATQGFTLIRNPDKSPKPAADLCAPTLTYATNALKRLR